MRICPSKGAIKETKTHAASILTVKQKCSTSFTTAKKILRLYFVFQKIYSMFERLIGFY